MNKLLYKPNNTDSKFNFVMAYPEKESFALSSLGYMHLFKISDMLEGVNACRISTDKHVCKFKNIDAIAFSLSFDFDFKGVFEILDANKIPLLSNERNENTPLIFAGGPVITTNPRPYDDIFDFMIIGDGEECFIHVLNLLKQFKQEAKSNILKELSKLDGVYIPSLTKGIVKKQTVKLENVIYTPILSNESYFKDTFIVELQRGCMNRCAFCTASYLNLPFRNYTYEKIIEAIELGLKHTNKIAILGAQISAHPDFSQIIEYIRNKINQGNSIELGISSLRADSVTPGLIQILVLGGQKTSTIAIEAASERLRKFINKNLSEEQIFNAVRISRENGLKGLKIYSMIGIPNENEDDIKDFIKLAKRLKYENKGFELTFSFSSFTPKPHTPLQWAKREDSKSLEKKQKFLEKELAKLGIDSKFSSIKWDYWQTLLSRGNSDLGKFMIEVYKNGGRNGAFKAALKNYDINYTKAIDGYEFTDVLPWDFIDTGISKENLIKEYQRLMHIFQAI